VQVNPCTPLILAPARRLSRNTIEEDILSETDNFELAAKTVYNAISLIRGIIGKSLLTCWDSAYEMADQTLVWTDLDACEIFLKEAENQGPISLEALFLLERVLRVSGLHKRLRLPVKVPSCENLQGNALFW
jgi:hypothetical protein